MRVAFLEVGTAWAETYSMGLSQPGCVSALCFDREQEAGNGEWCFSTSCPVPFSDKASQSQLGRSHLNCYFSMLGPLTASRSLCLAPDPCFESLLWASPGHPLHSITLEPPALKTLGSQTRLPQAAAN